MVIRATRVGRDSQRSKCSISMKCFTSLASPLHQDQLSSAVSTIAAEQMRNVGQLEALLASLERLGELLLLADVPEPSRHEAAAIEPLIRRAREALHDLRSRLQARHEVVLSRSYN